MSTERNLIETMDNTLWFFHQEFFSGKNVKGARVSQIVH